MAGYTSFAYDPTGKKVDVNIQNGQTFTLDGQRIGEGYTVETQGGIYKMVNGKGVKVGGHNQLQAPTAPGMPVYNDPYADIGQQILDSINNSVQPDNPYGAMLNQVTSQMLNRKFNYDPNTDPAYQAFRERALAAGDTAFANNLGGLAAATGGRVNTWAASAASQARNQYVLQAEMAVMDFEDRAYSRYQSEGQELYQLATLLDSQDTKAYNRYRDTLEDKNKMFDMVMKLSDNHYNKFVFTVEQGWKQYNAELDNFKLSLDMKQQEISEALDRVNMLGYVDNKSSLTLGIPAGTLSQRARERVEEMEDYIKKQDIALQNDFKKMEANYQYDMKLINARASSSGGGGYSSTGSSGGYQPTKTDAKERDTLVTDFGKLISGDDFRRMNGVTKYQSISDYIEKIVKDTSLGFINPWAANEALMHIYSSPEYQRNVIEFEEMTSGIGDGLSSINKFVGLPWTDPTEAFRERGIKFVPDTVSPRPDPIKNTRSTNEVLNSGS